MRISTQCFKLSDIRCCHTFLAAQSRFLLHVLFVKTRRELRASWCADALPFPVVNLRYEVVRVRRLRVNQNWTFLFPFEKIHQHRMQSQCKSTKHLWFVLFASSSLRSEWIPRGLSSLEHGSFCRLQADDVRQSCPTHVHVEFESVST